MKKLLLLITLLTSLFIGFTACSDNEPEVELDADDWHVPFGFGFSRDTIKGIIGELAYVKGKDAYQFLPDKSYNEIDSLMWMNRCKLRFNSSYTDSIKEIISQIGSKIVLNATVYRGAESNVANVYDFEIYKYNSSRSGWCGTEMGTPPSWFFEPMSRSSFNYSSRYESINVFVYIVRETNGNGFGKAQSDYQEYQADHSRWTPACRSHSRHSAAQDVTVDFGNA